MMDAPEDAWAGNLVDALGRAMERQARIPAGVLDFTGDPQPGQPVCYVPPGATAAEAAALVAAAHPVAYRRVRAKRPPAPPPPPPPAPPHAVLLDGRVVVSVPLGGDVARGRRFVVDLLAWDRVVQFLGADWIAKERDGASGAVYVVSRRVKPRATTQTAAGGEVVLARWLARAADGQVVTYRNGNTLDLTGRNLVLEDRGEFWEAHRVRPSLVGAE